MEVKTMLIDEVEKNKKEKICISVDEFKGFRFCDVRVYFINPGGEWRPTKKGITFNADNIDEIIDILKEASKELHSRGITKS